MRGEFFSPYFFTTTISRNLSFYLFQNFLNLIVQLRMKKSTALVYVTVLTSLFIIMACQKQKDIEPKASLAQTTSRIDFSLNTASTKCRISLDSAILYTTAFREHMETIERKEAGEYTIAYTIPAEGLLDLFAVAEQKGKKLKAIRAYRGIKNGQETLVYVAVDENNNDLIPDTNTTDFSGTPKHYPVEDQAGGCPTNNCLITPNILNSK